MLLVDVGVGKIRVDRAQSDEVAGEAIFDVDAAGMKRAPRLVWSLAGDGLGAQEAVRLYDEQAAAFDAGEALQSSCLRDAPETKNSMEAGPFVFFIFSANETAKVETPGSYGSATEIESAERNVERCSPAVGSDLCGGSPKAVPARVNDGIARERRLLFDNAAVALRAQGIDLKNVGVAMAESGVNGDGEIVVEILRQVAAKLGGDDGARAGVVAMDSDVKMARVVEDADFGVFRGGLGFEGFALTEV